MTTNNIIELNANSTLDMWTNIDKLAEIRKMVSENPLTDMEFSFLVELGKATRLNPFQREIWAVKYKKWNKDKKQYDPTAAQIFIGRDGYRKGAQRQLDYEYHIAEAVYSKDDFQVYNNEIHHKAIFANRGELLGAYCIVKRKSSERYTYTRVSMQEYYLDQGLWKTKPETMIKKVAEAQALRQAFQEVFAGTYHDSELPIEKHSKYQHQQQEPVIIGEVVANEPTQTNKLVQLLKTKTVNTGLHTIKTLLQELNLSPERYNNALDYYKVDVLEDLTPEQQESFIKNLTKLKLRQQQQQQECVA